MRKKIRRFLYNFYDIYYYVKEHGLEDKLFMTYLIVSLIIYIGGIAINSCPIALAGLIMSITGITTAFKRLDEE